jgi:hypothetical protein
MGPKVEKRGEFFWEIFEKTGSIEAFLLYHKSKLDVPQGLKARKDKGSSAKGQNGEK